MRLWQRHLLIREKEKRRRIEDAFTAVGGMMGGFFQGMMGANLAQTLNGPEFNERVKEKLEKRRKH